MLCMRKCPLGHTGYRVSGRRGHHHRQNSCADISLQFLLVKTKRYGPCSRMRSVLGSGGKDVASKPHRGDEMSLKERWRYALLAEVEEERQSYGAERGVGTSTEALSRSQKVVLSLHGRLYSEILWRVTFQGKGRGSRDRKDRQGKNVAFVREVPADSRRDWLHDDIVEGSIVEYMGTGDVQDAIVAVCAEDSQVLSMWSTDGTQACSENGSGSIGIVFDWKLHSVALERQLRAVECLSSRMEADRKGARLLRAILLGSSQAVALASQTPEWMTSPYAVKIVKDTLGELQHLNASQKRAIVGALTRSMTLWQGPPGTGKTRTLLGLTYVLASLTRQSRTLKSRIGKILAIAETNAAADNLIAGMNLLEIPCCRVGPVSRVRPDLRHLTWEARAEASASGIKAGTLRDKSTQLAMEAKKLRESGVLGALTTAQKLEYESQRLWKAGTLEMNEAMDRVMSDCDVIVATCISAGDSKLQEQDFRVVIVDEATQATEPSTLIALTRGAECVVMAGDHAQLPPTVISKKAESFGLGVSLFSRMQNMGIEANLLSVQYRMHPGINEFPSQEFYGGKISTGIHASSRPPLSLPPLSLKGDARVRFFQCEDFEKRGKASQDSGGVSYKNQAQCDEALRLAALVSRDVSVKSCVILTPYNGQVELLRRSVACDLEELLDSGWLMISTVDGFQGREADVVIFSTVRCNDKGALGFVRDPRRMNVAITRARRYLFVIGSKETLSNDPTWMKWIQWVEKNSME